MTTTVTTAEVEEFVRGMEEQFRAEPSIEPEELCDLVGLAMSPHPLAKPLFVALQKFLLQRTVKNAVAHVPYYQERAVYSEWLETGPEERPDLSCWPVLTRADVAGRESEFLADNVTFRLLSHTSGTTGRPLEIYKSVEEVAFLRKYYLRMLSPCQKRDGKSPLSLTFPNHYHGVGTPMPSVGTPLVSGVTDDTLIQDAARVLSSKHCIPGHEERISRVSGLAFHVMFFTSYLLEQGIDPKQFGVRQVTIAGNHIAQHWRDFISEAWGVTVNDRFSLTEMLGGATRIGDSHRFLVDPILYSEVLDFDDHRIVQEGIGLLTMTSYYPFVQMMPLLRYSPGDLVLLHPTEPGELPVFEFLGKAQNCLGTQIRGHREWLVFSAKLNEVLSGIPDLRIYDWFSNVRVAKDRTVGSLPIIKLDSREVDGRVEAVLKVELRYSPHLFRQRTEELREQIVEALRQEPYTTFAELQDSGALDFEVRFYGPEALDEEIEIKI